MTGLKLRQLSGPQRRVGDENEVSTIGMPWQIRAVALIGVPCALLCFLVWSLQVDVKGSQARQEQKLDTHILAAEKTMLTLESVEKDHKESGMRLEVYMRLLCVNGAKTKEQVATCLSVR